MAIAFTYGQFIERIQKHINDGFQNSDFKVTSNEIQLYINAAIPSVMKAQMYENAKVFNVFEVPEAYLVTYLLTLTRNTATNEWKATLPQTPLELPTGYNITDAYITQSGLGRGQSIIFTKTKRVPYRNNMPKPAGVFARINGDTIYLQSWNGTSLLNQSLYVEMPISRTANLTDVMNLPDGALEPIFQKVVASILQRYQIPNDQILDNLPAGNKTS